MFSDLRVNQDLADMLKDTEAVVFAVRLQEYLKLNPDETVDMIGGRAAFIDCFGILDDEKMNNISNLVARSKVLVMDIFNELKIR